MVMANRKGQSTVEYAVLAAVVIGALVAMQVYVKRGAMGRLKESADQMGEQFNPSKAKSDMQINYSSKRQDVTTTSGVTTSTIQGTETQGRTGSSDVNALTNEKLFDNAQ